MARATVDPVLPGLDPKVLGRQELVAAVVKSLHREIDERLVAALLAAPLEASCFEASVRCHQGQLRAGRMMIERASLAVVIAVAESLRIPLSEPVASGMALAQEQGLPLITGWDRRQGDGPPCLKLYVNASDASQSLRGEIRRRLLPGVRKGDLGESEPALVGWNLPALGPPETKIYLQGADAVAMASGLTSEARALAAEARREGAEAGGVLSLDVGVRVHPRAFFVALREPPQGQWWEFLRSLDGFNEASVIAAFPFPPAPPRSVGISLSGSLSEWTLYAKPRASGSAPRRLEPTAVFRSPSAEVGIFVEPVATAARAFRRTEHHAVSVRVRHGSPVPEEIEALVDWFAAGLGQDDPAQPPARRWTSPPAPWKFVDEPGAPA